MMYKRSADKFLWPVPNQNRLPKLCTLLDILADSLNGASAHCSVSTYACLQRDSNTSYNVQMVPEHMGPRPHGHWDRLTFDMKTK